jgi:hypothetical protein
MSNTKSSKALSRILAVFTFTVLLAAIAALPVLAQGQGATPPSEAPAEGIQEGGMGSIPPEIVVEDEGPEITQAQLQQQFVTGIAAGIAVGVVIGGALVWFIKPSEA